MDLWEKMLAGAAAVLSSGSVTGLAAFLRKLSTGLAVAKTRLDAMETRIVSLEKPSRSVDGAVMEEIRRDVDKLERKLSKLESNHTEVWRTLVSREELNAQNKKLDRLIEGVGNVKGKLEALSGRL